MESMFLTKGIREKRKGKAIEIAFPFSDFIFLLFYLRDGYSRILFDRLV